MRQARQTLRRQGERIVVLAAAVAAFGGCTEATSPHANGASTGTADRYYRLGVVADLVLHVDGTYALGNGGELLLSDFGRWDQRGDTVQITPSDGGQRRWLGVVTGDTLALASYALPGHTDDGGPASFRFVRIAPPVTPLAATRWVLRAVNGAAADPTSGFLVYASDESGRHDRFRVTYDTLTFVDRLFYRQVRAGVDSSGAAGSAAPAVEAYARSGAGAFETTSDTLRLRYGSAYTIYNSDVENALALTGSDLVRRYQLGLQQVEERYERLP
ncbi:MAG TPA: hypothetical protein VGD56_19265 [Gemmatirosa sp.]